MFVGEIAVGLPAHVADRHGDIYFIEKRKARFNPFRADGRASALRDLSES
jgi:hypothetical protein